MAWGVCLIKYYLGLDNGGTTTKAGLYDENGKEIGTASVSTDTIIPVEGYAERDLELMWQANCRVIHRVIDKTGVSPKDIAGVGVCGHGKGLYLWGKDDKPLYNGIMSTDNRAYKYVNNWKANGTEKRAFEFSCQHIMACQPVALLAWMKDNDPETYGNIKWVFECKDYVRFRLTGVACGEISDYSGTGLVNLHTRSYDRKLLDLFGIPEVYDALPPLCHSDEICGFITDEVALKTGLAPETPVIGGMFDINACAVAANVLDTEHICMVAGTWSINEYLRREPVLDGRVLMNSLFCMPEYYLIEESSPTSAGNNEWFIQQLLPEVICAEKEAGRNPYSLFDGWVEDIPPEEFVPVFLPFLMGSNVHPNAKSAFIGLGAQHTRRHMLRSVYEGIAFSHRYHFEKLMATRDNTPKGIRLVGGAANSRVWTQMFADIMKLPVETLHIRESGALGCAVAAAVATGKYKTLQEAADSMCALQPAVEPEMDKAKIYDEKYSLYVKAIKYLDPLWSDVQNFIEKCR